MEGMTPSNKSPLDLLIDLPTHPQTLPTAYTCVFTSGQVVPYSLAYAVATLHATDELEVFSGLRHGGLRLPGKGTRSARIGFASR